MAAGRPVARPFKLIDVNVRGFRHVTGLGFNTIFHLAPEQAQRLYFQGRHDHLAAPVLEQLMSASVEDHER